MNQPNAPTFGMPLTAASVASLPNPEAPSPTPASMDLNIEMEVRKQLRLREEGINREMEAATMAFLREQGFNWEAASMPLLPMHHHMMPFSPQQQRSAAMVNPNLVAGTAGYPTHRDYSTERKHTSQPDGFERLLWS